MWFSHQGSNIQMFPRILKLIINLRNCNYFDQVAMDNDLPGHAQGVFKDKIFLMLMLKSSCVDDIAEDANVLNYVLYLHRTSVCVATMISGIIIGIISGDLRYAN